MKYCTECGRGLPQPNPKFCPNCGAKMRSVAGGAIVGKPQAKQPPKAPPQPFRITPRGVLLWVALLIVFFSIAFLLPSVYWGRAEAASTQYYQYMTAFGKDSAGLSLMGKQYDAMPMGNDTFEWKARAADAYAQKASQVLTSWNYTLTFLKQNGDLLQSWNVSASSAESQIEDKRSEVQNKAASMAEGLQTFAGSDQNRTGSISGTLKNLRQVWTGSGPASG